MTTDFLNSDEAAALFLNLVVAAAYDAAIEGMVSVLEQGPPGQRPSQELAALYRWFQDLDNESRECVLAVIQHACDAALFHCLVFLDGLSGYAIGGEVSDFAVYLQTYENKDARKVNSPLLSVRLNPAHTSEFLHDVFHRILQERAEREK